MAAEIGERGVERTVGGHRGRKRIRSGNGHGDGDGIAKDVVSEPDLQRDLGIDRIGAEGGRREIECSAGLGAGIDDDVCDAGGGSDSVPGSRYP